MGASWAALEPEIVERFLLFDTVYGIELKGSAPTNGINIDHHIYDNDDRGNALSSIEQVAEVIGVELSLREQFISMNDKEYIPMMEHLSRTIIDEIRAYDRTAQGITKEHEREAMRAIRESDLTDRRLIVIRMNHSKTSPVCDRLYGKYVNLLILSSDGEINFFGSSDIIDGLIKKFPGGWSGAAKQFWGGYASQDDVLAFIKQYISHAE